MLPLHRIDEALASREAPTIRIVVPDVLLFVAERWVKIGHVNLTKAGAVMCMNLPPLDELVSTPDAEAAGWDAWAVWGARVN